MLIVCICGEIIYRYIVILGSEDGFVPNMNLVFIGQKKGDYHEEMNAEKFLTWFEELCQALPGPSTIVMDNASYHNKRTEDSVAPTSSTRKAEMIDWLSSKNIAFDPILNKPELYQIIKQHKARPIYRTDVMANEWGHEVLRTPVRQCELNPIELIWAKVKTCIASRNSTFKLKNVTQLVHETLDSVEPEDWRKCVGHVIEIEKEYRKSMQIMDEIDPVIINLGSDSDNAESDRNIESDDDEDSYM